MAAYAIIRHKVRDFAHWKKVFDGHEDFRKKGGERSAIVIQVDGNPNDVVVINSWPSIEAAKAFFNSKELKEAMKEAGVASEPQFTYGKEPGSASAKTPA